MLGKIKVREKRDQVLAVLYNPEASHYDRLWMVGFLKYIGYTKNQVLSIIHEHNDWTGYDARITYNQVDSVYRRR